MCLKWSQTVIRARVNPFLYVIKVKNGYETLTNGEETRKRQRRHLENPIKHAVMFA